MKANVGKMDKMVRIVLALALFSTYFTLEGDMKNIAFIGLIPLLTGFISFCPLYKIFGINTCKDCK